MCKEADRPHRRHRPRYIAPTAGPILHPEQLILPDIVDPFLQQQQQQIVEQQQQQHQQSLQVPFGGGSPLAHNRHHLNGFGLLQSNEHSPLNVNSLPPAGPRSFGSACDGIASSRWKVLNFLWWCYHWMVDALLLIIICVMGCFFYDVEVKVVKTDRRQDAMTRGGGGRRNNNDVVRSGRVIIRTDGGAAAAVPPRRHRLPRHHTNNSNYGRPRRSRTRRSDSPEVPNPADNFDPPHHHLQQPWNRTPATSRTRDDQPTPWDV